MKIQEFWSQIQIYKNTKLLGGKLVKSLLLQTTICQKDKKKKIVKH